MAQALSTVFQASIPTNITHIPGISFFIKTYLSNGLLLWNQEQPVAISCSLQLRTQEWELQGRQHALVNTSTCSD